MQVDFSVICPILTSRGYLVKKEIGNGSQGVCLVVYSEKYKIDFAAKVMKLKRGDNDTAAKMEFEREVYSLSHIIHPNIVNIYDYFAEGGYLFMIIEYCPSGSLNNKVRAMSSRPSYNFIRGILCNILNALCYCHETKHISHHDIKLHNILIDGLGHAKLCDFGLSQLILERINGSPDIEEKELENIPEGLIEHPEKQNVGGSILYMSPELLYCTFHQGCRYDMFAADMWAVGVTLYFLLTGRYPFVGHTKADVYYQQKRVFEAAEFLHQPPIALLNNLPSDIPEDLEHVLMRCLDISERNRGTAKELFTYLELEKSKDNLPLLSKTGSYSCHLAHMRSCNKFKLNFNKGCGRSSLNFQTKHLQLLKK